MTDQKRASPITLGELHEEVAKDLLRKVRSGTASAAELSAAIKFLKDNGIEAIVEPGDDLDLLTKAMPNFKDDGEEAYN